MKRVFVCYSRSNSDLAKQVVDALRKLDFEVLWDQKISGGEIFNEEIRSYIAHSHLFVPIITQEANKRGWVHQEIGYGVAMDVTILPLLFDGTDLEGMAETRQGVKIPSGIDTEGLVKLLRESLKREQPVGHSGAMSGIYSCAYDRENRARLISAAANSVTRMKQAGTVCHHGAYTAFAIPDAEFSDPGWIARHGGPRDQSLLRAERDERRELEKHAKEMGCRLIIRPKLDGGNFCGDMGRASRIQTLLEFLHTNSHPETLAVIDPDTSENPSQLVVGNWFAAESRNSNSQLGYRHTVLTRHAPTVEVLREDFEQRFNRILKERKWTKENCRELTIRHLEGELAQSEC